MAKWIDVAPTEEIPAGKRKHLKHGNTPICVINTDGKLYAICNICPHAGLPLAEGDLNGKVITCPFHGYSFDIETGRNVDFADDVPMGTFPVRVEDGKVQIDVEKV